MNLDEKPRVSWLSRAAAWIFDTLASVELAVFVILAIAAVSAVGTVVESKHGAAVASLLVYRSPIFTAILVLFLLNLAFAAFSRLPWKRHHIGFLVTHLGLITVIVGSVATRYWGVDGNIAFGPGEAARSVRLDANFVNVFAPPGRGTHDRLPSQKVEVHQLRPLPGTRN